MSARRAEIIAGCLIIRQECDVWCLQKIGLLIDLRDLQIREPDTDAGTV